MCNLKHLPEDDDEHVESVECVGNIGHEAEREQLGGHLEREQQREHKVGIVEYEREPARLLVVLDAEQRCVHHDRDQYRALHPTVCDHPLHRPPRTQQITAYYEYNVKLQISLFCAMSHSMSSYCTYIVQMYKNCELSLWFRTLYKYSTL